MCPDPEVPCMQMYRIQFLITYFNAKRCDDWYTGFQYDVNSVFKKHWATQKIVKGFSILSGLLTD